MRILSISLCIAAVACVAAQTAPEQAAFDASNPLESYSWATTATEEQRALATAELVDAISEIEFRSLILSQEEPEFQAEGVDCSAITSVLGATLEAVSGLVSAGAMVPVVGSVFKLLNIALGQLKDALASGAAGGAVKAIAYSLDFAFTTIKSVFMTIQMMPLPLDLSPVFKAVQDLKPLIRTAVQCASQGAAKAGLGEGYCNTVADLYRVLVEDSASISPALNLAASASADLKRAAEGSLAVLNLSKSAIAASNDALLSGRPIFSADLLSQYRDELLRAADTDEIKIYAQTNLGAIVGVSNALDACIRVAANPEAAADELDAELAALARFEDVDDE